MRELPFVMGVMGDFSGDPTAPLQSMADRKFVQIDRDNFNDVMARMNPGLNLRVDNKLSEDGRADGGRPEVQRDRGFRAGARRGNRFRRCAR